MTAADVLVALLAELPSDVAPETIVIRADPDPNTLLISEKLHTIAQRPRCRGSDVSVLRWFLAANTHITKVSRVRELDDAGGYGVHGLSLIHRQARSAAPG